MIHLTQDQELKTEPGIKVAVPTGDYNETDLIECYKDDPAVPICMYQAQYIALGRDIYHQSDELTEDQVAALLSNTPADQVINNRKMIDGKNPAAKYVGRIVKRRGGKADKLQLRDDFKQKNQNNNPVATTTEPIVLDNANTNQASTTATTTPNNVSTSTPQNTSTTTPPVATTTPDINPPIQQFDNGTSTATSTASSTLPSFDESTTTPIVNENSTTTSSVTSSTATSTDEGNSFVGSTTPAYEISTSTIDSATTSLPKVDTNVSSTTPNTATSSSSGPSTGDKLVSYAKKKIVDKIFNI